MRKVFLSILAVFAIVMVGIGGGCTGKKPEAADSVATDSVQSSDSAEVVDSATKIIAETPMPKAADQLFDDFFFNFIANGKLQKNRIKFPLEIETGEGTQQLSQAQWKTDHFFRKQGYYTIIFDNEKQMKAAKSTDIDSVTVEKIHLKKQMVEQYLFDHQDGKWKLNKIRKSPFSSSSNASFLDFLAQFLGGDGLKYVKNPLSYTGPDPDGEETSIVNRNIPASEWSSFLPEVPKNTIYNILYGQKNADGNKKILTFRGLSNGIETQLVFKRNGGSWQLVKLIAY